MKTAFMLYALVTMKNEFFVAVDNGFPIVLLLYFLLVLFGKTVPGAPGGFIFKQGFHLP